MFLIYANLLSWFGLLDGETNHFDKAQAVPHEEFLLQKNPGKKVGKKTSYETKKIKDTYGLEF